MAPTIAETTPTVALTSPLLSQGGGGGTGTALERPRKVARSVAPDLMARFYVFRVSDFDLSGGGGGGAGDRCHSDACIQVVVGGGGGGSAEGPETTK